MQQTKRYLISGLVQGVGFRWATVQLAKKYHVTGTVANLPSGQVAVEASGTAEVLEKFYPQLPHVNPWAHVQEITVTDLPPHEFADFRIII